MTRDGHSRTAIATCDVAGCTRRTLPFDPDEAHFFHRCALHEIASYNADELRKWGEDNAADMVDLARAQLELERQA